MSDLLHKPPHIIWFCSNCKNEHQEIRKVYNPVNGTGICPIHNVAMDEIDITAKEYLSIISISENIDFLEAMIELKKKDIIEYETKMSQFRNQTNQQRAVRESSVPKCPHCHSTNIKSISALNRGASVAMWGLFSKKINKSFECKNCGYTW